jgi:hypothetical protein
MLQHLEYWKLHCRLLIEAETFFSHDGKEKPFSLDDISEFDYSYSAWVVYQRILRHNRADLFVVFECLLEVYKLIIRISVGSSVYPRAGYPGPGQMCAIIAGKHITITGNSHDLGSASGYR